jgi:hypothetical protein
MVREEAIARLECMYDTDGAGFLTYGGACTGMTLSGDPSELLLIGSDTKHRVEQGDSRLGKW